MACERLGVDGLEIKETHLLLLEAYRGLMKSWITDVQCLENLGSTCLEEKLSLVPR